MAAPTSNEIMVLQEFRREISDLELKEEDRTDMGLLRWLRARDLDISKANDMLRNSLIWRKEEDLDNIFDWEPPETYNYDFDYEIVGRDTEGRPIAVVPMGVWDIRAAVLAGEREQYLRYVDQFLAKVFRRMRENSKLLNSEVTQIVIILDFADFSIRQMTSMATNSTVLETVRRFEANYPETLHSCYVVNAAKIFSLAFAIIKPMLSARTLSKVQIYTAPSKWKPVLLNNLPRDQLPFELGGSRGGRRVSIGGTPHKDRGLVEEIAYITISVDAGQKFELEYAVVHPNTRITWKFKTDDRDIGFSITRERTEEVLTYKRYDSHLKQEEGELICDAPGEYFITFDNTYSMLRGKVVQYLIETVDPEEDNDILEVDEKIQNLI